jgi:hypothetical protein
MGGMAGWFPGFVALVSLTAFACSSGISWDQVYQPDAASFKAAVMRVVPIGTAIAEAKSKMEEKGFKCNMVFRQSYSDYSSPGGRQVVYPSAGFLSCVSARTVKLVIEKDWDVALFVVDGKVTAVATNVYLTGM